MIFDNQKKSPELVKQGATAVGETKVGDAAQAAGKLVGAAVAELVTGKGAAVAFKGLAALSKTESGALLLAKVAGAASKAKEAVGSLAVPVAARAVEIALTDGSKIRLPLVETKRLDEVLQNLESRAAQALSGTAENVGKVKSISLPAWNKLTVRLEADGTPHLINNHKVDGKGYLQSLKDGGAKDPFPAWMTEKQILNTVKEAYGSAKKVGVQNFKDGKVITLEGNFNGMKIRIHLNLDLKQIDSAYPVKGGGK